MYIENDKKKINLSKNKQKKIKKYMYQIVLQLQLKVQKVERVCCRGRGGQQMSEFNV